MAQDIRVIPELVGARRLALAHNVLPVTHSFVSDLETPVSAFLKLGLPRPGFLLESAEQGRHLGRHSFLGLGCHALLTWRDGVLRRVEGGGVVEEPCDDPFAAAAAFQRRFRAAPGSGEEPLPPLAGGLVGYFGYDLVRTVERLPQAPPDPLGLPDMALLVPETVLVFDHLRHVVTVVANAFLGDGGVDEAYAAAVARIREVRGRLGRPLPAEPAGGRPRRPRPVAASLPRPAFTAAVRRLREYIHAGDVFQVVLSRRLSTPVDVHPFAVYRGLRTVNPSPYLYYLAFPEVTLCGSSPEPLVTVRGDDVETRPIAGTRPRGADPAADARLVADLLADEKERAEHLMLVDLGRNDIGRVCRPGSVRVERFMDVEHYSHVIHLVSSVRGRLALGRTPLDALRAVFPAGTVSGAPKVRAMELIDELEPVRRGPYAGAVGYLSFGGDLDSCICIRTVVLKDGVAHVQAGAGVVADSDPGREFAETESKAAALLRAVELAHGQFAMPPDPTGNGGHDA